MIFSRNGETKSWEIFILLYVKIGTHVKIDISRSAIQPERFSRVNVKKKSWRQLWREKEKKNSVKNGILHI